jgi:hypothetical protein
MYTHPHTRSGSTATHPLWLPVWCALRTRLPRPRLRSKHRKDPLGLRDMGCAQCSGDELSTLHLRVHPTSSNARARAAAGVAARPRTEPTSPKSQRLSQLGPAADRPAQRRCHHGGLSTQGAEGRPWLTLPEGRAWPATLRLCRVPLSPVPDLGSSVPGAGWSGPTSDEVRAWARLHGAAIKRWWSAFRNCATSRHGTRRRPPREWARAHHAGASEPCPARQV